MRYQQEHKDGVLSAVREFVQSASSDSKVAADMSSLVDATSHLPLSNLDDWERLIRWEYSEALRASNLSKQQVWNKPIPFLTWIDLCSRDGFRREKALHTLSGAAPNSFFFAIAVHRLNDWVFQVRKAAQKNLLVIAKESKPEHVVDVLYAILPHWNSWGRAERVDKQILLDIAAINEVTHSLKLRIISATTGPVTSILTQIGQTNMLDNCLIEIATQAIQPSVRAKAYQSLLEGKIVWFEGRKWEWTNKQYGKGRFRPIFSERRLSVKSPFLKTLKLAAVDRSPIVRRVAGELLIRELTSIGEESLKLAKLLASDPSPSVSGRGQFALRRLEAEKTHR